MRAWWERFKDRPSVGDVIQEVEPVDWRWIEITWLECMHSSDTCVTWRVVARWKVER